MPCVTLCIYCHEANNQRFWTEPEVQRTTWPRRPGDRSSGSFWAPSRAFDHLADCTLETLFRVDLETLTLT